MNLSRKTRHRLLFLQKPFYDLLALINPYPKTFRYELEEKLAQLKKTEHLNTGGGIVFFSDFHWDYNAKHSAYIIKRITEESYIRKVFFGGDIITLSEKTKYVAIDILRKFFHFFSFLSEPLYFIYGNHDNNSHNQKHKDEILNIGDIKKTFPKNNQMHFFSDFSYYIDDENCKTRYICLDTGKQYTTENELENISSVLKSVPYGFHIIILTHIVLEFIEKKYQPRETISKILNLFDSYNNSNTYGHIECIIGGHIHNDYVSSTKNGIPIILTDCDGYLFSTNRFLRKRGHLSEQCVNVIIPDYKNDVIRIIRFGYGDDKTIRLINKGKA